MKAFIYSHYLEQKHFDALKQLLGKEKVPKALFITTAAVPYGLNPKPKWLEESLTDMRQFAEDVDETSLEDGIVPKDLNQYGFVFVAGGRVFYLAYRFAETGMDAALKTYVQSGGVYCGSSAGGAVLMESIEHFASVDDSSGVPKVCPGLGLIDFAFIPHADSTKYAGEMKDIAIRYEKEGKQAVFVGDNQVLVLNGSTKRVI